MAKKRALHKRDLRQLGWNALVAEVGVANATRCIMECSEGEQDYAKLRRKLFAHKDEEALYAEIKAIEGSDKSRHSLTMNDSPSIRTILLRAQHSDCRGLSLRRPSLSPARCCVAWSLLPLLWAYAPVLGSLLSRVGSSLECAGMTALCGGATCRAGESGDVSPQSIIIPARRTRRNSTGEDTERYATGKDW